MINRSYLRDKGEEKVSKEKQEKPIIVAQVMGKWVGGGVESVIMNYYRHLDHSKVQFDFICDEDSTRIPYDEIKKLGGRVFLIPKYQNLPKYLKALGKLLKENQYRIVHSNINTLSVFPLYAAKKAGVPVRISHSHSTSNPKVYPDGKIYSHHNPKFDVDENYFHIGTALFVQTVLDYLK